MESALRPTPIPRMTAPCSCLSSIQELGPTRSAVLETAVRQTEVLQKQAAETFTLAEEHETKH
jgi:hypothetical protein